MDFVKLYTTLLTHPKTARTSPRAWQTLTFAWMYAGEHETDGYVPIEAKPFIRMTSAVERELEDLGWMHRNGAGWVIHDWSDHQVTRADLDEQRNRQGKSREANRVRQARRRSRVTGDANAK